MNVWTGRKDAAGQEKAGEWAIARVMEMGPAVAVGLCLSGLLLLGLSAYALMFTGPGLPMPQVPGKSLMALEGCFWLAVITLGSSVFLVMGARILHLRAGVRELSETLEEMARGRLDVTASEKFPKPCDRAATAVNGLAVDFQETLLFIWRHTQTALEELERLGTLEPGAAFLGDAGELRESLEEIQSLIRAFTFFEVHIAEDGGLENRPAEF